MKVHASLPVRPVGGVRSIGKEAPTRDRRAGSDSVQLSDEAHFIQGLQQAARDMPQVRADAVQQARADIASGQLGSEQDLDTAVDAILAGL